MENKPFHTRDEAAQYLTEEGYPTTKGQLAKRACIGGGPIYQIYGNKALYTSNNLLQWAQSRLSAPRSSTKPVNPRAPLIQKQNRGRQHEA